MEGRAPGVGAFLVVDSSLYYRYNRLFAQSPDSLTSAFLEPASANTNGKDAAGAEHRGQCPSDGARKRLPLVVED